MQKFSNPLPPHSIYELMIRCRTNKQYPQELHKWMMQAEEWLLSEANKARRSARSWERKGEPKLAQGWQERRNFALRIAKQLLGTKVEHADKS